MGKRGGMLQQQRAGAKVELPLLNEI